MKLDIRAFSVSLGVIHGLVVAVMLLSPGLGWQMHMPDSMRVSCLNMDIPLIGAFLGLAWGFVSGLVCGAIFSWTYNKLIVRKK